MISLRTAQKWRSSMLERYFVRPDTIDRIRASWVAEPIERYVEWLTDRGYASRNIFHRVPILRHFGEFARARGATAWDQLPGHVEDFVDGWLRERGQGRKTDRAREKCAGEVRNPIEQMLRLAVPGFAGHTRRRPPEPFCGRTGAFFRHLLEERGLRVATIVHYHGDLAAFEAYLRRIDLHDLRALSPAVLSAFIADSSRSLRWAGLRNRCGVLRVFLRYLARERLLPTDLSASVEFPRAYRSSTIPRSIAWADVRRMLEVDVDRLGRRTPHARGGGPAHGGRQARLRHPALARDVWAARA